MTPVYRESSLYVDGKDDSFDACLASILDKPLSEVSTGEHNDPATWGDQWKVWFANRGLMQEVVYTTEAPAGFSIASMTTVRVYPEGHPRAGEPAPYACVMYNGSLVHDPHHAPETEDPANYTIDGYFSIAAVFAPPAVD